MLTFKEIELSDKKLVDSYFKTSGFMGCEYTFSNLFIWRSNYKTSIAEDMGLLTVKYEIDGQCYFLMPAGNGDIKGLLTELIEESKKKSCKLVLSGLTTDSIKRLEALMPDAFRYEPFRDGFDYIYESEQLINLTGSKNQSKRNHINKFESLYGKNCYENITKESLPQCKETYYKWAAEHGEDDLKSEYKAFKDALNHFEELGLKGGLLRVDGEVCAFALGTELSKDVFVVHIEKGLTDHPGVYPTINREFVKNNCTAYRYINREEDMGIEGLRKSKLSYHPAILLEKHNAYLK
ncbi:MAG: hypothetical protein BGN88_08515 [Clostridiales bacterium 43-6]|nr:MAG: hypothetical protein BGN88_08515 [Clostridiales bacterium 43-6]